MRIYGFYLSLVFLSFGQLSLAQEKPALYQPRVPIESFDEVPVQDAKKVMGNFSLYSGFKVDLVAKEPNVVDPIAITFDEQDRIWAVELRSYMRTALGENENGKLGRIVVLSNKNRKGYYKKSEVFLDKLSLTRAIALAYGGLLYNDGKALYWIEIDGTSPKGDPLLVDPEYNTGENMEHSENGLMRGLDNWIYNAKSNVRYRRINGKWLKQKTQNRGQFGISMDNEGRLFYTNNSTLLMWENLRPNLFKSTNPVLKTNPKTFPSHDTLGANRAYIGGVLKLDSNFKMTSTTCAAGLAIYRGDNFPSSFENTAFVTESVGNFIKALSLKGNHYDNLLESSEFLASKHIRFRPVNLNNAPDGTLYLVDFYRGLIQHHYYLTPYLYKYSVQRNLIEPIGLGRLYRIRYKRNKLTKLPKPKNLESWIALLAHPNGWWRDKAQQVLVESQQKSLAPAIQEFLSSSSTSQLGKVHALWTLEGLEALDSNFLIKLLKSNSFEKKGHLWHVASLLPPSESKKLARHFVLQKTNSIPWVELKAATLGENISFYKRAFTTNLGSNPLEQAIPAQQAFPVGKVAQAAHQAKFLQYCGSCHGNDAKGLNNLGPPLMQSQFLNSDKLLRVILHGIQGELYVNAQHYSSPLAMPGLSLNKRVKDQDIADIANYIRKNSNKNLPLIKAQEVKKIRKKTKSRNTPYTQESLYTEAGYKPLFNKQNLNGWVKRGGEANYEIVDGAIRGTTNGKFNTFLCTKEDYTNFDLLLEFKVNPKLNSGIQFRSNTKDNGRVWGYQAEIDPSQRAYTAGIYEEAGRKWLFTPSGEILYTTKQHFRHYDWNQLRIRANGNHIQTWLNGFPVSDIRDTQISKGFIGLQVHGIYTNEKLQIDWRNIYLKKLPETE